MPKIILYQVRMMEQNRLEAKKKNDKNVSKEDKLAKAVVSKTTDKHEMHVTVQVESIDKKSKTAKVASSEKIMLSNLKSLKIFSADLIYEK
uniref:Uncharacterized protein n=1 Tax=Strongyloides venezuelensis TaxID=75913 RepID=A0A0K0FQ56_STRVS